MVTTADLSDSELADLQTLTNEANPAEAVRIAMRAYLRYARRMRLKELSGQVEMAENWQLLEQSELMALT